MLRQRALSSRSSRGQRKTSVYDGESSGVHLYFPVGQEWGSIECALELRMPGNGQELRKDREKPMVDTQLGSGGLGLSSSPAIQHPLEPLTAEELVASITLFGV